MCRMIIAIIFVATAAHADDRPLLWKARCSACHGKVGRADTKMGQKLKAPDFSSADWQGQISDEVIRSTIRNGKPKTGMRPMREEPTDAQIEELVVFIRTLGPGTAIVAR